MSTKLQREQVGGCLFAFILLLDGGRFGLAVSIPMKHVGPRAYKQVVRVHKVLTKTFSFRVYDMYYGTEVDKDHLKQLRQEIT